MYSKAKIFGHPIHPILVAYPIVFYTVTPIAFLIYAANQNPLWFRIGLVTNVAGVVTALLAAVPGFIDWALGLPKKHPGKTTGLIHMISNVTALLLFTVNAILHLPRWDDAAPPVAAAVALTLAGTLVTFIAGYLGWNIIARHHVGVELTPEQARFEPPPHNAPRV